MPAPPLPLLRLGTSVAEVGNWQRFLNEKGVRDLSNAPLVEDEVFGPKTVVTTARYQRGRSLMSTGVVDSLTRKQALSEGFIPFVQAQHAEIFYPNKQAPTLIVLHTMENPEKPYAAENVAAWFAGRAKDPAPQASAHYCIDEDSVVQCVRDTDRAWHAGPVNGWSLGLEHTGYARQSTVDWFDGPSQAILRRSAKIAGALCRRFAIPIVLVSEEDIAAGTARGFCGHVNVTKAFKKVQGHWDPGPNFPYEHYLDLVRAT